MRETGKMCDWLHYESCNILTEFSDFLVMVLKYGKTFMVSDFLFHVDHNTNVSACDFLNVKP